MESEESFKIKIRRVYGTRKSKTPKSVDMFLERYMGGSLAGPRMSFSNVSIEDLFIYGKNRGINIDKRIIISREIADHLKNKYFPH